MSLSVETASATRDPRSVALALVQLTKPSITRMVLVTAAGGALIAPGPIHPWRLAIALFGTALVVGAANALNMVLERDVDGMMQRTSGRPLPSGRIASEVALAFGIALAFAGLTMLSFFVNAATGLLAALALVSYVLVYTPLKRVTPYALHAGAVPGAIPPLIGWASVTGSLSAGIVPLFAILFVWQLPHFLAISLFRQEEYERAGLRVHAAVKGPAATRRAIVGYSALLALVSLLPLHSGPAGVGYALVVILLSLAFLVLALRGLSAKVPDRWARTVFFASLPYLVIVYGCAVFASL